MPRRSLTLLLFLVPMSAYGVLVVRGAEDASASRAAGEPGNAAIAQAMKSVSEAAARVADDPARPQFHVLPPAMWINDPNGPLYHNGYFHLFYQHNPYDDDWGRLHWGHVRSRDLAHWEHLPIALWPSLEQGEEHCFSGCAVVNRQGQPMILYTSIGPQKSAADSADQWAALGDAELITWRKHPDNPVLDESLHGDTKIYDWRDPFVFEHEGQTFAVLGGNLNRAAGGQAIVALYEAQNDALTKWKYCGILFQHPDPEVKNIECPNFFPLDGRWVLVVSPHRQVEYFVGDFDAAAGKFTPASRGLVDHSDHYYAPNGLRGPGGRWIEWGWLRGFPGGRGWNGCLSVPREWNVDRQGRLVQRPAAELSELRGKHVELQDRELAAGDRLSTDVRGHALELIAEFEPDESEAVGLRLTGADNQRPVEIVLRGDELEAAGVKAKLAREAGEAADSVRFHVFLDHSVLEVFCGEHVCISRVIEVGDQPRAVEVFAEGGAATLKQLDAWDMGSIWHEGAAR